MKQTDWMIYGATGHTGRLIAVTALCRGGCPVLAGRSAEKLKPLAEVLALPWRELALEDEAALRRALPGVKGLINAAGPFGATSALLARACIAAGVHYLDVSNEIGALRAVYALDTAAKERGVALLPGFGFGTVASNCLSKYLHEALPEADHLTIVLAPYTRSHSRGARRSMLLSVAGGGYVRRAGELLRSRLGRGSRTLDLPWGKVTAVPAPLGDLEAAFRATGIGGITTCIAVPLSPLISNLGFGLAQAALNLPFVRALLSGRPTGRSGKRPAVDDIGGRSFVWGSIGRGRETWLEAWLELGEGYDFTAEAVVTTAERIADAPPGAHTPASVFGADFVLSLPEVTRTVRGPFVPQAVPAG